MRDALSVLVFVVKALCFVLFIMTMQPTELSAVTARTSTCIAAPLRQRATANPNGRSVGNIVSESLLSSSNGRQQKRGDP